MKKGTRLLAFTLALVLIFAVIPVMADGPQQYNATANYETIKATTDNPGCGPYGPWKAGNNTVYGLTDILPKELIITGTASYPYYKNSTTNNTYGAAINGPYKKSNEGFTVGKGVKLDKGFGTHPKKDQQEASADAQRGAGADDREGESLDGTDGHGRLDAVDSTAVPYTLKIRGGVSVDSKGKGAGKGALIQKDLSATLGVSQDQYLFQPMAPTFILDNIGGQAEYGKQSSVSGTLRAGGQCAVGVLEEPVICLQGNGIDRADTAGCNGKGWKEDTCYTLNTIDRPAVAYSINQQGGSVEQIIEESTGTITAAVNSSGNNRLSVAYAVDQGAGKSSCSVHDDIAPTLATTHGGAPAVAYGLDRAAFNQGKNAKFDFTVAEEAQPTLTARGPGAVCTIGLNGAQVSPTLISRMSSAVGTTQDNLIVTESHPAMCCTTGSFTQATEEISPTLMARDWKDPTVVCSNYIVRRLTPTECARLQGFADRWGWIEAKKELTDEEYHFWMEVRNTHAELNGKVVKEYTKKQMLTWYNKLWTDSAEYKMWGNGIALPTALYCIQGMAEVLARATVPAEDDDWMN